MTTQLEIVDLGDARRETRQITIVPLYFDSLFVYGIRP
jgi:hypothetical protein